MKRLIGHFFWLHAILLSCVGAGSPNTLISDVTYADHKEADILA